MMDRVPSWAAPGKGHISEPPTLLSLGLRVFAVPAMALLWWALAFLAWQSSGHPTAFESLRPTLPAGLGDLGVALFGPLGAALVVMAVFGRWRPALLSVLLGFVIPAAVTVTRGIPSLTSLSPAPFYVDPSERTIMLVMTALAAVAGLGIGTFAIGSLQRFGFLGLLAVAPVVSFLTALLLDPRAQGRWLTGAALVMLLVMIAWRRWAGVLLWPAFFVLYWLLNLARTAFAGGAQTLRHRGGGTSAGGFAEAMLSIAGSAWRVLLGASWDIFWPAALIAAVVIATLYLWRRTGQVDA